MKPKLVILTTHFGTNFSGGSTASCEIFSRIENSFSKIVVIGTELGSHPFSNIKFIKYHSWFHAIIILKIYAKEHAVFYGDFYNSFLFILAGVRFYFTYHDNWPELQKLNFKNRLLSFFYTNIYQLIFRRAIFVIAVSDFKYKYIQQFTKNSTIVSNGFNTYPINNTHKVRSVNNCLLMVGNIDDRKYKLALAVFKRMTDAQDISVDIYGHIIDKKLARELNKFSFVHLKGFQKNVPYSNYKMLLHTSFSESFGMIFCEAIYYGIPVITFDVGGAKEIISNQNGWLVEPYDIDDMVFKIEKGLNEKVRVNRESLYSYSWDKASISYLRILQQC